MICKHGHGHGHGDGPGDGAGDKGTLDTLGTLDTTSLILNLRQ